MGAAAPVSLVAVEGLSGGVGSVVSSSGSSCEVTARDGTRHSMKRARSCLLVPQQEDVVLFSGERGGVLYVLAVLEREDEETELSVEGRLSIKGRSCQVRALESIELRAGSKVSVASTEVEVRAHRGEAFFGALGLVGRRLSVEVERVRSVAVHVDRLVDSVRERVKNSYRTVEELDHTRAGSIDIAAEGTARVHGRHTLVGADALVKINGPQVHLG